MNGWTWLGGAALLSSIVLLGGVTLFGDSNSPNIVSEPMSKNLTDSDVLQTNAYARSNNSMQDIENKFIAQNQEGYLASWFATPDIKQDQVLKLQAGYDYATSKGKPFIIDGVYNIKANRNLGSTENVGLIIRNNSDLRFTSQAKLKLISENKDLYSILIARDVDNYKVYNPYIVGDRLTSKAKDGEWGYGLTIYESSNGYIEKPVIENVWGDGIYVGKAWGTDSNNVPTNITILQPLVNGARRNGISFTSGENVHIVEPRIQKVGDSDGVEGAWPKACIDVEPENAKGKPAARIINSVIESPTCEDSYAGLYVYASPDNLEMSLHVKGITTLSNISNTGVGFFHGGVSGKGEVLIDELYYKTPTYQSMALGWNKDSDLKLVVEKVTHLHKGANFGINSVLNGSFFSKKLGNVTIKDIEAQGHTFFVPPKNSDAIVDGYKLLSDENDLINRAVYK